MDRSTAGSARAGGGAPRGTRAATRALALLAALTAGCVGEVGANEPAALPPGGDDAGPSPATPDAGRDAGDGARADGGAPRPDAGPPPVDAGPPPPEVAFEERDGVVAFEAEHYTEQTNTERIAARWVTFEDGAPAPTVDCVTDTPCTTSNRPHCNQYPTCDGDSIDPAEAVSGAYVEALPDRRRNDEEPNTGSLGVVNQGVGPTLRYEVWFTQTGRYYVWARARGQGPAANGLHVGIDGTWPRNELVDPSNMRLQFPSGWRWTQNRRGQTQHTGVSATATVSRRDANVWLEVEAPGLHVIELSMREDGLELDKVVLVKDPDFEPTGDGPAETTRE